MGDDDQTTGKADTSDNKLAPVNREPPAKAHEHVATNNPSHSNQGIGWDRRVELFFTFAILAATAVNVCIANKQWSAMTESNAINREAFSATQRPFIAATALNFLPQTYGANSPQYWDFIIILENGGNTPTQFMTVTSAVSFDEPIVPYTPADPVDLKSGGGPYPITENFFLVPHGKAVIEAISLHNSALNDMANARQNFFVYGIVRYFDQFSGTEERITKFCFVVVPFIRNGTADPQNRGTCHHWNCGDKDCERDKRSYEAELQATRRSNPKIAVVSHPIPIASVIPTFPSPIIKAQ